MLPGFLLAVGGDKGIVISGRLEELVGRFLSGRAS
jgi:hypothetical protein